MGSGTGSNPPGKSGLHRSMRYTLNQRALKNVCFWKDCMAYSEQEGLYLHAGGRSGEINRL